MVFDRIYILKTHSPKITIQFDSCTKYVYFLFTIKCLNIHQSVVKYSCTKFLATVYVAGIWQMFDS